MSSEKTRIGIIGAGAIAQVTHIPILDELDDVEIVAVCDQNKKKAQLVAEKFGIAQHCGDPDDLFKNDDIHAVHVCTPTHSHRELTTAALSAQKHVLVEKPMARSHDEAKSMADYARRYDRRLMVAMNVRHRQDAITLKTFTQKGELGKLFYGKTGWLRRRESLAKRRWFADKEIAGGGVFMDLGIQMLDVGLWLMGEEKAVSVTASTYNNISNLPVEDSAAAFIRLTSGATLTIEVSWTLLSDKDFFYTNLFGENGGALLNPLRIHKELHGSLVNVTPARGDTPQNLYKRSYENEIRHFIRSVQDKTTPMASLDENLERMRIVDAVYESANSRSEVIL